MNEKPSSGEGAASDRAGETNDDPHERVARTVAYYDRYASEVAGRIERRDVSRALDGFCALAVAGAPVLDIGCGTGAHLAELARRGVEAVGIEPSSRMRQIASAKGLRVVDGTFESLGRLGLPDAGGAWCAASLLHVPVATIPTALESIRSVLVPGAPLFATVRLGSGASWDRFDDVDAEHERFIQLFGDTELTTLIATAGFAVLEEWFEESTWGRPSRWVSILAQKPG
jgi:SAM-dependent methyltransferase